MYAHVSMYPRGGHGLGGTGVSGRKWTSAASHGGGTGKHCTPCNIGSMDEARADVLADAVRVYMQHVYVRV